MPYRVANAHERNRESLRKLIETVKNHVSDEKNMKFFQDCSARLDVNKVYWGTPKETYDNKEEVKSCFDDLLNSLVTYYPSTPPNPYQQVPQSTCPKTAHFLEV